MLPWRHKNPQVLLYSLEISVTGNYNILNILRKPCMALCPRVAQIKETLLFCLSYSQELKQNKCKYFPEDHKNLCSRGRNWVLWHKQECGQCHVRLTPHRKKTKSCGTQDFFKACPLLPPHLCPFCNSENWFDVFMIINHILSKIKVSFCLILSYRLQQRSDKTWQFIKAADLCYKCGTAD